MFKNYETGMRGVYLVAAELAKLGFITSLPSRNAFGADILVTDSNCKKAYSVQVKTITSKLAPSSFWLLNKNSKNLKSNTHIYVFVNLNEQDSVKYFIVPSKVVSNKMWIDERKVGPFYSFTYEDAKKYQNKWSVFIGRSGGDGPGLPGK